MVRTGAGEVGLFLSTVGLFGGLTVGVRDATAVGDVIWRAATLDSPGAWDGYLALVAAVGVALLLHEGIHALTARLVGCEATIGRQGLSVHVRLSGGVLSRRTDH